MRHKLALCFTFLLLCSGLLSPASADEANFLQEANDRVQIEDLMWRYVRALDSLDEVAYANVFTQDGQFGSAEKGHVALKKMITDLKESRAKREAAGEPPTQPMHHMIVNHSIEFTGKNKAFYHSYWMTVFAGSGPDIPVNVAAAGRGIDELARVNGEWLIKFRNVSPQD